VSSSTFTAPREGNTCPLSKICSIDEEMKKRHDGKFEILYHYWIMGLGGVRKKKSFIIIIIITIIIYKMKSKVFAKAVCKASSLFYWL